MPAVAEPITDYFPPELRLLSASAATVLDTHVSDEGCCTICRSVWPCERVQLADHNLAAL